MTSRYVEERGSDGDALGRAHDAADEQRIQAFDEAEDVRAARSFWRELPILVAAALLLAVVLKVFVVQGFYIPSSSMEQTLQVDDRIAVSKLSYRFGSVDRGDVVVFDDPSRGSGDDESLLRSALRTLAESVGLSTPKSEFIKRVVGLEGETIEIRCGALLVDGVVLAEPYVNDGIVGEDFGPITVPADHVFVLGDNRRASRDGRIFGPIPVDDIVGRAFVVIWPPRNVGGL